MMSNGTSQTARGIASINPATGLVLRSFESFSPDQVEACLRQAVDAFAFHRRTPFEERAGCMRRLAGILDQEKHGLARLITLEMGKTLRAAAQEIEKCAFACTFYAERGAGFLADEEILATGTRSRVRCHPLGPVLAVMPWNFPFWQVFRFAVPALMAGNVGLLKPASNVPQCALAIESLFRRSGFHPAAFQTLLVGSDRVAALIADPRVAAVTLTGSVAAGRSIAGAAGRYIKKTVLELGGSDPFIVMPGANLERAVAVAAQARITNNGQSCIAAKRFIIARPIAEDFERRFVERMASLHVGDPLDDATEVGPLATAEALHSLQLQVDRLVQSGARVLLGGRRLDRPGFFFPPTVLTGLRDAAWRSEELFGPVALVFRAADLDEALQIANDTPFGLGASFWSNDRAEQDAFIDRIEAGLAFVNAMVASDPRLPFGGIRQSGYGRELGREGIREFVNVKTVVCQSERFEGAGG